MMNQVITLLVAALALLFAFTAWHAFVGSESSRVEEPAPVIRTVVPESDMTVVMKEDHYDFITSFACHRHTQFVEAKAKEQQVARPKNIFGRCMQWINQTAPATTGFRS